MQAHADASDRTLPAGADPPQPLPPALGPRRFLALSLSALWIQACSGGDTKARHEGPPATSAAATLCGTAPSEHPVIDSFGVGPITVEKTIAQLRQLCPELRDTSVDQGGVSTGMALTVEVLGSVIVAGVSEDLFVARSDSEPLDFVAVVGGGLRTRRGVGPGSTLDEVRRAYGKGLYLVCSDGSLGMAMFERPPLMQFWFGHTCSQPHQTEEPPSDGRQKVRSVEIWVPT